MVKVGHAGIANSKERVGVNISANDSLLVTAGDKIQLIDNDGLPKDTFEIPMPIGDNLSHNLSVDESAIAKTLLVRIDLHSLYFLRADSLSLIAHCHIPENRYPQDYPATIADNIQMSSFENTYVKGGPLPQDRLFVGPFCAETKDLWGVEPGVEPFLLDNSTVLEVGESDKDRYTSVFEVRKIGGEVLWVKELSEHFHAAWPVRVRTTRDGSRFAVEIDELRGGNRALDIGAKTASIWVQVYDSRNGKQIAAIKVPKEGLKEYALSANGDKVATLSADGSTLEVWKL
jgi:hypothetical protein